MIVLKYFHEEPASLEALSSDHDPDARRQSGGLSINDFLDRKQYFRGYLTATDLSARRFGLTCLPEERFAILLETFVGVRPASVWFEGGVERVFSAGDTRGHAAEVVAVVIGEPVRLEAVDALSGKDRRRAYPALQEVLDSEHIVLLPEPAHHGTDLSFFSASPLRLEIETAIKRVVGDEIRAFSIPQREARSEEKFYFELYDLERYRENELTQVD